MISKEEHFKFIKDYQELMEGIKPGCAGPYDFYCGHDGYCKFRIGGNFGESYKCNYRAILIKRPKDVP